jgi:hypothetical protein
VVVSALVSACDREPRTGNLAEFFEDRLRLEQVIVVSYGYNQQMLEEFRRGNHER